jgi:acetate kinase
VRALALNAGSSTLKAALYDVEPAVALAAPAAARWEGQVDWDPGRGQGVAVEMLRGLCDDADAPLGSPAEVDVVGHRIVHGGARFRSPTRITGDVKEAVGGLSASAPLHNAAGLAGVAAAEHFVGDATPHVAVFDTAFHVDLPAGAHVYAGPHEWLERGLRRFGFHGINHQYAAHRAAHLLGRPLEELRLITCHLGSGCSLAAIRDGRSVDTTMGFTPLEGLVMGTRSGSVDPGLLLHLLREPGASVDALDTLLNHRSGLRGLSGRSGDLREVLAARERGDATARLALEVYVHRLRFHLGAMLGALAGLDAVVFTAGVGEHSAEVRAAALEPFAFLGVELDRARNTGETADADIAADGSRVRVLVTRAREEWAIARAAVNVVAGSG